MQLGEAEPISCSPSSERTRESATYAWPSANMLDNDTFT